MNKLILISIINLIFFFTVNAEEVFEGHSKASELIDKKSSSFLLGAICPNR